MGRKQCCSLNETRLCRPVAVLHYTSEFQESGFKHPWLFVLAPTTWEIKFWAKLANGSDTNLLSSMDKTGVLEPVTDDVDARKREHFRARLRHCYNTFSGLNSLWREFDFDDNPEMYTEELYMHNQATLAHELKQKYAMWLSCGYSRPADDVSTSAAVKRPFEHLKMDKKNRVVKATNVKLVSPSVVGQDGKPIIGTLEAHVNGFMYKSRSCSFHTHVLYKNVRDSFFRVGDNSRPPLLHFHLYKDIKVGTEMAKHIQFVLVLTKIDVKTQKKIDEKAQKKIDEKGLKKKIKIKRNKDLRSFVEGVEDKWHKVGIPESFESLLYEFTGILPPRKTPTAFALTWFSLVGLVEEPFSVVRLSDIEIVNLAKLRGGI